MKNPTNQKFSIDEITIIDVCFEDDWPDYVTDELWLERDAYFVEEWGIWKLYLKDDLFMEA